MIKFVIGGSPCTHWTIQQSSEKRETTSSGLGWELFLNYAIAVQKIKPDYFLYENNKTASKAIKEEIDKTLKHPLHHINSSLLSAQNRERFYCRNWEAPEPIDAKVEIKDILEEDVEAVIVTKGRYKETKPRVYYKKSPTIVCATGGGHIPRVLYKGVSPETVTNENIKEKSRELKVNEVARLQTMPENYFDGEKKTNAFNALGNGWTAEIIIHQLKYALAGVPKTEKIVVVAMYDGIATGRYCFEKLGYTNIEYYAFEIDPKPINIAMKNYPDIIQCGDAFQLRDDSWLKYISEEVKQCL